MTSTSLKLAVSGVALSVSVPLAAEAQPPVAAAYSLSTAMADNPGASPLLTELKYERLYRRLIQAGMLSQVLDYTLAVDPEGKVTGCSFSRQFRMEFTQRELCRAFARSHSFDPARDSQGSPVSGNYSGKIEVASFFQPNL